VTTSETNRGDPQTLRKPPAGRRLLILCSTTGYQTRAFVEAAQRLDLEIVFGSDRCHVLEDPWQDDALPLRFEDPKASAERIVGHARNNPLDAVVALGDRPTPTGARAAEALGLPYHAPAGADACRDKFLSRQRLHAAGLNVPNFARFSLAADERRLVASHTPRIQFPCVLKPLALAASRGVIRADTPEEFVSAFERIRALLRTPEIQVLREETSNFIQVETYVEGTEVAVEAVVDRGRLNVLAIFDKPDPLVGPYFEETMYVTPSILGAETQAQIRATLVRAVKALELHHGPMHAEVRINAQGAWILEVAARSIGGLCSRALRFCSPELGDGISLEELILRLALGEDVRSVARERAASGVLMIPVSRVGVFQGVEGIDAALETPGVEEIRITAKPNQKILPWPEGSSYLGFIFARGESPGFVEQALRAAHAKLSFVLASAMPII
jgi:biotin carboxylase